MKQKKTSLFNYKSLNNIFFSGKWILYTSVQCNLDNIRKIRPASPPRIEDPNARRTNNNESNIPRSNAHDRRPKLHYSREQVDCCNWNHHKSAAFHSHCQRETEQSANPWNPALVSETKTLVQSEIRIVTFRLLDHTKI